MTAISLPFTLCFFKTPFRAFSPKILDKNTRGGRMGIVSSHLTDEETGALGGSVMSRAVKTLASDRSGF